MDGQTRKAVGEGAGRRWAIDLAMMVVIGLLMGFLAPFDSERTPMLERHLYWLLCIVGGGLITIPADGLLIRRVPGMWVRVVLASVLATPVVSLLVLVIQKVMVGQPLVWSAYFGLFWQVCPILMAVLAVRALAWRRLPGRVETRTIIAPPHPEAEAAFRQRLSAKRRGARLIAVEAHDHYLKVHTDLGVDMVALRFADALDELAGAYGWRVHRSWWVAADAVEEARWRRGVGELRLVGGLIAPVSRTYRPVLKDAGWF